MDEETKKVVNEKIRELLKEDNLTSFDKAKELLKILNNPLKCE